MGEYLMEGAVWLGLGLYFALLADSGSESSGYLRPREGRYR
jgi:hypothetical protein